MPSVVVVTTSQSDDTLRRHTPPARERPPDTDALPIDESAAMTGVTSPGRADPGILIRDGGVALGDDSPRSFDVTNRGDDAVRLTGLDVEPMGGMREEIGYEAVVDVGREIHSSMGTRTLRFDDPVVVDRAGTATVYLHGTDGSEPIVTLHSERDGQRHETTMHLSA